MPGQDKFKVIIVDDIKETRDNIQNILRFSTNIEVVGESDTAANAIELCTKLKPDVVVMDINLPDMDGITVTELLKKKYPSIQVIFLSVQNDPAYMRKAMRAGASDYLTKPPSIDDLIAAIQRAGETAHSESLKAALSYAGINQAVAGGNSSGLIQPGKTILIYGPKGGAGCTTLATNLAIALHSQLKKENGVILVDANLQYGDIPVFLNEQVRNTILDLTSRVDDLDMEVINEVVSTHAKTGIKYLASPQKIELADKVTADNFIKLLDLLTKMYSYVVIDTSTYLTDAVSAAIDHASILLLVITQEIPAIRNASLFLNLAQESSIGKDRMLLIMNKYDRKLSLTPERVADSLKIQLTSVIPFDDRKIGSSIIRGVPIYSEEMNHPISKCIHKLAEQIINQDLPSENKHLLHTK